MSADLIPIVLIFTVAFFLVFYCAELLSKRAKFSQEISRKFAHVASGIISLFFPIYIQSELFMLFYTIGFAIFFFLAKRNYLFTSITRPNRKTFGSWLFPLAILISYLAYYRTQNLSFFFLPMLVLTFSDSLASLIGERFPIKKFHVFGQLKSIGGSFTFLITSFLIFIVFSSLPLMTILLLVVVITIVEAVSVYGSDNLTIPLTTLSLLYATLLV